MLPGVPTTTPSCMLMDNRLNNTFRWSRVCSVFGGALQPPQRFSEQSWTWEPRGGPWDGDQTHVFFLRAPQIILIGGQVGEPPGWEHLSLMVMITWGECKDWAGEPSVWDESHVAGDGEEQWGSRNTAPQPTHRTICSDGPASGHVASLTGWRLAALDAVEADGGRA